MKKPNVLLIMADQMRGDCMGCAGHPAVETPWLDMLASEGTRFANAYTASPSCVPARATLMTGMNQWHTGILGMGSGMKQISSHYAHTLPGELANAGYHTKGVGKMHFSPMRALNGFHATEVDESSRSDNELIKSDYRIWFDETAPAGLGYRDHGVDFNSWMARPSHLPEYLTPTHWTASRAVDFLAKRDPEKPFFLKCSFARPHSPYDPPQVYYDMYINNPDIPKPYVGEWCDIYKNDGIHDVNAWWSPRSERETHRARAAYYGNITFIDHSIGRLIADLRRWKLYNDCWIIFTSDHGDMLGDHHLWRKTYAYEGSAHIPLIIRPPMKSGYAHGQVIDRVTELRDIMPTILDMAGLQIPDTCDGRSLLPLMRGEDTPWREYIQGEHCACYSKTQENYYVTDGHKKFIWLDNLGVEQFFDLDNDPGECVNRIDSPAYLEDVEKWRGFLIQELNGRDCGLVKDGKLYKEDPSAVVYSPHAHVYGCQPDAE